jgi:putative oxidoreductase
VNRTLPGPAGDVALLLARLILGTIMFAHGYQKLFINGLGRTTQGFENMSIPVAIVSAAYVTVVELVGSVLVLGGALITVVAGWYLVVMVGAAVFVHIPHGIFAADNGWELVGAIAALLLVLAAAGPGRWSLVGTRQGRPGTRAAAVVRGNVYSAGIVGRQPSAARTMNDVPIYIGPFDPAPCLCPGRRPRCGTSAERPGGASPGLPHPGGRGRIWSVHVCRVFMASPTSHPDPAGLPCDCVPFLRLRPVQSSAVPAGLPIGPGPRRSSRLRLLHQTPRPAGAGDRQG